MSRLTVLGPDDGDIGLTGMVLDRFMIDGQQTGGRFALVEYRFAPHSLAAPVHRHHLEDEYTYVLRGHVEALVDGAMALAGPGELILKPRLQWHTLWNPGDEEARVLELISPAGLETFFRWLMDHPEPSPEQLEQAAAPYRCDVDAHATRRLLDQIDAAF